MKTPKCLCCGEECFCQRMIGRLAIYLCDTCAEDSTIKLRTSDEDLRLFELREAVRTLCKLDRYREELNNKMYPKMSEEFRLAELEFTNRDIEFFEKLVRKAKRSDK